MMFETAQNLVKTTGCQLFTLDGRIIRDPVEGERFTEYNFDFGEVTSKIQFSHKEKNGELMFIDIFGSTRPLLGLIAFRD